MSCNFTKYFSVISIVMGEIAFAYQEKDLGMQIEECLEITKKTLDQLLSEEVIGQCSYCWIMELCCNAIRHII